MVCDDGTVAVQDQRLSQLKAPRDGLSVLDCDWASSDKPVLLTADNCVRVMELELRQSNSPTDLYQFRGGCYTDPYQFRGGCYTDPYQFRGVCYTDPYQFRGGCYADLYQFRGGCYTGNRALPVQRCWLYQAPPVQLYVVPASTSWETFVAPG